MKKRKAVIRIIPIPGNAGHQKYLGIRKFKSAESASHGMRGCNFANYSLQINGRNYAWPTGLTYAWAATPEKQKLTDHIQNCIEIDASFYIE